MRGVDLVNGMGLAEPGSREVFTRGLGVVYALAFLSLGAQILGLYGSEGILPMADILAAIRAETGVSRYWSWPTVFWIDARDEVLRGVCAAGVALGMLVAAGRWVRPGLFVLWGLYLSVCSVGLVFMSFQWDALLLGAGFLAVFFAAGRPGSFPLVALGGSALLRVLAVQLFFFSGTAKLMSGDPAWWDGTALLHHFETQPLPTPLGAWLHHGPDDLLRLGSAVVFVVQVILPWGLFGPAGLRRISVAGLAGLQLLIAATGNYGFFNVLAVLLLVPAICDRDGLRLVPASLRAVFVARMAAWAVAGARPTTARADLGFRRALRSVELSGLGLVAVLNFGTWVGFFAGPAAVPSFIRTLEALTAPFELSSRYGLFASVTKERLEVRVEGSADGEHWRRFRLPAQPEEGDPPRFVAPHQPRLDWQMWFAALRPQPPAWFGRFLLRILDGSKDVRGLLEADPFGHPPPRQVRALIESCELVDPRERALGASKSWWVCRDPRIYFPATGGSASVPARP